MKFFNVQYFCIIYFTKKIVIDIQYQFGMSNSYVINLSCNEPEPLNITFESDTFFISEFTNTFIE